MSIRQLVFTALFAAFFIVISAIKFPLPFSPVPINLQTFGIMLVGACLGARYGFLSILLVVALTTAGFPLPGGEGGLARILGPTGGYIWLFPVGALLVGLSVRRILLSAYLTNRRGLQFALLALANFAFGSLLCYVTGVAWLGYSYEFTLERALALGMYPFLLGDAFKSLLAAGVVLSIRAYLPQLRSSRPVYREQTDAPMAGA